MRMSMILRSELRQEQRMEMLMLLVCSFCGEQFPYDFHTLRVELVRSLYDDRSNDRYDYCPCCTGTMTEDLKTEDWVLKVDLTTGNLLDRMVAAFGVEPAVLDAILSGEIDACDGMDLGDFWDHLGEGPMHPEMMAE